MAYLNTSVEPLKGNYRLGHFRLLVGRTLVFIVTDIDESSTRRSRECGLHPSLTAAHGLEFHLTSFEITNEIGRNIACGAWFCPVSVGKSVYRGNIRLLRGVVL